ncbi:MAG: tetratricopeptide repeat protein [Hyphomicrobiaceae bacterium]
MESEFISTTRKPHLAVVELEAARRLQPNNPDVLADLAKVLSFAGRPMEARELIQRAMELNPDYPEWYFGASGIALLLTEDYQRAVSHLRKWSLASPSWRIPYIYLAAVLAGAGDVAGAKKAVARYSRLYSPGTLTTLYGVQYKYPMENEQRELFQHNLRLAGVR